MPQQLVKKTLKKKIVKDVKKAIGKVKPTSQQLSTKRVRSRTAAALREHATIASVSQDLGDLLGSGIGGLLGRGARALSTWLGAGDYTVRKNSMANMNQVAAMHSPNEDIVVRHREYIGDVIGNANGSFTINSYALNPGVPETFPWLSTIACCFQQWEMLGGMLTFHTTSSDLNLVSQSLGQVMIATAYDAIQPDPTNKQEMLNMAFSSDTKPSADMCHPIECDPLEKSVRLQYIRSGALPTGQDKRFYDLGTIYVATNGITNSGGSGNVNLGELWFSYEVVLRKPKVMEMTEGGPPNASAHYQLVSPSNASSFGTSNVKLYDSIGLTLSTNGFSSTNMIVGSYYLLVYQVTGTSVSCSTIFTLFGLAPVNSFRNQLSSAITVAGTGTTAILMQLVLVTGATQSAAINSSTIPTTPSSADFFVIPVDSNFV